jgi:hypothetical protein
MTNPVEPLILYFGTPVVLISTLNENTTLNDQGVAGLTG